MLSAEPVGRVMLLEAAHTSDPSLDPSMVLFKSTIQVDTARCFAPSAKAKLAAAAADRSYAPQKVALLRLSHSRQGGGFWSRPAQCEAMLEAEAAIAARCRGNHGAG